jgi:hypothetical protein
MVPLKVQLLAGEDIVQVVYKCYFELFPPCSVIYKWPT